MTQTPAAWIARLTPALRPVARKARVSVRSAFPGATEYVHFGVIRYGLSAEPRDWVLYIAAQRDHLNLGFVQGVGAAVPDPTGIIEGSGRTMRHATLRTVADAERPALKAVLRAVAKLARTGTPARRRQALAGSHRRGSGELS